MYENCRCAAGCKAGAAERMQKMKKGIAFTVLSITCALVLSACSCAADEPVVITQPSTTQAPSTEAPTQEPATAAPETTASETTASEPEFAVSLVSYEAPEGSDISYPQLTGLRSESDVTRWNDYFRQDAASTAEGLSEGDTVTVSWRLSSQTSRLASLVKITETTVQDAAYPTVTLTSYNIDPSTGDSLRLHQLCSTNSIAADLIAADKAAADGEAQTAYTVTAPDGTDVTRHITMEGLLDMYEEFIPNRAAKSDEAALAELFNQMDFDGKNPSAVGCTYWQDGTLHLVFPYIHAVGDYIDIAVKDAHRSSNTK